MKTEKIEETFDALASEWDEYRAVSTPILPYFLSLLPKKKNLVVLDAGCGNGRNAVVIARLPDVTRVIAVDISAKMLAFGRKRVRAARLSKKIRFVKTNFAKRIPLPDASVDAAFYLASIHHLNKNEQERAFAEMRRVLRKHGLVFGAVWNKKQKRFKEERAKSVFVSWQKKSGARVRRFHYFFEPSELRALAKKNGLAIKEVFFESEGAKTARRAEAKNICFVFSRIK